jgi:hypothetical protein
VYTLCHPSSPPHCPSSWNALLPCFDLACFSTFSRFLRSFFLLREVFCSFVLKCEEWKNNHNIKEGTLFFFERR